MHFPFFVLLVFFGSRGFNYKQNTGMFLLLFGSGSYSVWFRACMQNGPDASAAGSQHNAMESCTWGGPQYAITENQILGCLEGRCSNIFWLPGKSWGKLQTTNRVSQESFSKLHTCYDPKVIWIWLFGSYWCGDCRQVWHEKHGLLCHGRLQTNMTWEAWPTLWWRLQTSMTWKAWPTYEGVEKYDVPMLWEL